MSVELVKYVNDSDVDNIPKIHHHNVNFVKRVLEDVRIFIVEKGHIVFGGLAIDAALKLKGSGIYNAHDIPDYDTISTNSVNDAYELANLLFKNGYGEDSTISVIKAIHTTTMRVRVNQDFVADFGYCPPEIFKKIPTIDYDGMTFVSPLYQRADMYMSLANPMQGKPFYNIYNRSRKDVKRLNMLDEHCPIVATQKKYETAKISYTYKTSILFGFGAYAILHERLSKLCETKKLEMPKVEKLNVSRPDKQTLEFDIVKGYAVTVYDDVKTHTHYRFLDLFPESYRSPTLEQYDRFGRMITYSDLDGLNVASPAHTIAYFLMLHTFVDNSGLFLMFYCDYVKMVSFCLKHFPNEPIVQLLDNLWGTFECNTAYSFKIIDFSKKIGIQVPDNILKQCVEYLPTLPKNMHIKTTVKSYTEYTYDKECKVFKMSGEEIASQTPSTDTTS